MKKIVITIAVFLSVITQRALCNTATNIWEKGDNNLILSKGDSIMANRDLFHISHASHCSHASHYSHYSMAFDIKADSILKAPEVAYQYVWEVLGVDSNENVSTRHLQGLRLYIAPGSELTTYSGSLLLFSTNDTCLYISSWDDEYIIPFTKTYFLHNIKKYPRKWEYGEQVDWMKELIKKLNKKEDE